MKLIVNGQEAHIEVDTLDALVEHYGLNKEQVVAEVDSVIVDRSEWSGYELHERAKIELVHFVGGG